MSFAIGPVHLLLTILSLVLVWRIRKARRQAGRIALFWLALLLLAAFVASTAALFLWERLPLLQYLEFPWRFLSLVALSASLLCGFPFLVLPPERHRLANGLMLLMIACLFLFGFPHARPEAFLDVEETDYSPQAIARQGLAVTTAREYEPIWVQERPPAPAAAPVSLLEGQGHLLSSRVSPTHLVLQADIAEEARLQANVFYFPGWTLYVDGAERPIHQGNPQGLIRFSLAPGTHKVEIRFTDTPVRLWSKWLSLGAVFLLLVTPGVTQTAPSRGRQQATT